MDLLHTLIQFVLHLDVHLAQMITLFGPWTYALLFLIVFCETGLIVTPFLPGDSLLFTAGALAARGDLSLSVLLISLIVATLCGDNVNYWIGRLLGPRIFHHERSRFFKKSYLDKTHAFYESYGAKAIIIARFIPIVRTFCPFVAGIGAMRYRTFLGLSIFAAVLWVCVMGLLGFWFGQLAFVRNHVSSVILGIIVLSLLPPVIEWLRHRCKGCKSTSCL